MLLKYLFYMINFCDSSVNFLCHYDPNLSSKLRFDYIQRSVNDIEFTLIWELPSIHTF